MVIPSWQKAKMADKDKYWKAWSKGLAILALANFSWVIFDISYVNLRSFLIKNELLVHNNASNKVLNTNIPWIISNYDKIKGIKKSNLSDRFLENFYSLNQEISINKTSPRAKDLIVKQKNIALLLIEESNDNATNKKGLETIKEKLRKKTKNESYRIAIEELLDFDYLTKVDWSNENLFWKKEIIPITESIFTNKFDIKGNKHNYFWQISLSFQIIFLIDIIIRSYSLKRKLNDITWIDAISKRWLDIPLIIPFFPLLRIFPVIERLSNTRIIQTEPIRAAISQWIVALLAIEIFEILTIKMLDTIQSSIDSPRLPTKIRNLCSYQLKRGNGNSEISDLVRLWLPILLQKIGPNMRQQLIAVLNYSLQRSMKKSSLHTLIKPNLVLEKAEEAISSQLSSGMVDTLLGFSKNTGDAFFEKDNALNKLSIETIDQFWEELADSLESEDVLNKTQFLLTSIFEKIKLSSFQELKSQNSISEMITELDDLNFNTTKARTN